MNTVRKVLTLLTPAERRRAALVLGMILVMAVLDTVGVASILPLMSLLADPTAIESNRWLSAAYDRLGFMNPKSFLFFLGIVSLVVLVFSIAFKALTQYALLRFSHMRSHSVSRRLFGAYLDRPYTWFLDRHSADLGKTILSEVPQVINGVIIPGMQIFAHGAVAVLLVILLLLIEPVVALATVVVLGGSYVALYLVIRRYLAHIGVEQVRSNRARYRAVQDALAGIKDVKIYGREDAFFARFVEPSRSFSQSQSNSQIAAQLPHYFLEILTFTSTLLLTLFLFQRGGDIGRALPLMTVFAFAAYRLLPGLQYVYRNIALVRVGLATLDSVQKDFQDLAPAERAPGAAPREAIVPRRSISLHQIHFAYPGGKGLLLRNLNLEIPVKSTVGLMGVTGSGKTTIIDLIAGVLPPLKGDVRVDDVPITPTNVASWLQAIGYVPQHIHLTDDTVAANIAFGVPSEAIDFESVERAARIAELHDAVKGEMPDGYATLVGERGIRLSGGQRQRIGIARALYRDPAVLLFDEATNALDESTEQAVMKAIRNLRRTKTIVLVSHRLSSLRECDRICVLGEGRVVEQGTFDEVVSANDL